MQNLNVPVWRVPRRVAYVVSHSYPYSNNGYAVRTHGIASTLVALGHSVLAINRPGRPWELPGFVQPSHPSHTEVDGVRYLFTPDPSVKGISREEWLVQAEEALIERFRIFKPSGVMAASNWENALPALRAARKLDLPFFYEVLSFEEIARISREPAWADTDDYRRSVEQESYVARNADRVFTLNRFMCDELVSRGVSVANIQLVRNAWGDDLPDLETDAAEIGTEGWVPTQFVVGYVGSFTPCEGLDDLVHACAELRQLGLDVSLLLVGSSNPSGVVTDVAGCPASMELLKLAKSLEFAPYLRMVGRVQPDQLGMYYKQMDLVVNPRKAWPVCELVSPIKTIEAAAHGVAVLASDVAPLAELVDGAGVECFVKSDIADMVMKIMDLLNDGEKRSAMGRKSRDWVKKERSFRKVVEPMVAAIRDFSLPVGIPGR